jgi:hypothetical protein
MNKICTHCSTGFEITDADLALLKTLSPVIGGKTLDLPAPTLCPDCREQRRLSQSNQINLYERKCDLTGASIISNYHADSPYTVYRQNEWYSDAWDAMSYGKDFDFTRPFFEQWQELSLAVPRPSLHRGFQYDENSDYTNYAGKNKNCYMIFDSDENRDCYFSYSLEHCENCTDCFRLKNAELCYECVDSIKCYNCAFVQDCDNCSDSLFLKNCVGCKNCIMCVNMANKEYCVDNKQVTKEEFESIRAALSNHSQLMSAKAHFDEIKLTHPHKFFHGVHNENVVGDYLTNCKDAFQCYDSTDLWDCRYVYQAFMQLKTCMDIQQCGDAELCYESCYAGYNTHGILFCAHCLGEPSNLLYCTYSPHSKNLFGCVGMMRKEYCILNKQYTKEEYEELVPKIVDHMKKTGEWGEFFPSQLSTFAYNESWAQEYFPLTQTDIEARGWRWQEDVEKHDQYMGPKTELPDGIGETNDAVTKQIFICETSGKPYKILPQELDVHRKINVPLPRKAFFQRHRERMALRNPRKIWQRSCAKCQKHIETTYAPDRPEIVYCEECYLSTVY